PSETGGRPTNAEQSEEANPGARFPAHPFLRPSACDKRKAPNNWRAPRKTRCLRIMTPRRGSTKYGRECARPKGCDTKSEYPSRPLGAPDCELHDVPHQRNLVCVMLKRQGALNRQISSQLRRLLAARLTSDRVFDCAQSQRPRSYAIHRDADTLNRLTVARHRRCHAYQGEVPYVSVPHLLEVETGTAPGPGDANGCKQVARLQDGHSRNIRSRADEVLLRGHYSLTALGAHDHRCIECDQRRSRIRWIDSHAAIGAKNRMFPVHCGRRVRIADVSTRAVTEPACPVIPASRVLRDVTADRALVPNLG